MPVHWIDYAAPPSYATILQNTYNASEIWPLVNISSGTTIPAFVNSARNGTLSGWSLQNGAGPVAGTLAPLSDGTNDYGNIYSASLASLFNGSEGSWFGWFKVSGSGVWTDGVNRRLIDVRADGSNFTILDKIASPNNRLECQYRAGGTAEFVTVTSVTTTDWFSFGVSWSISSGASGEMKVYFNGSQFGATQTTLGTWGGSGLSSTNTTIGATGTTPTFVWDGYLAYIALRAGAVWSATNFLDMHNAAATAGAD